MILPIDFENQMRELLGDEYASFRESYDTPHFSALRRNRRKISASGLSHLLNIDESLMSSSSVAWEKSGIYYISPDKNDDWENYAAGSVEELENNSFEENYVAKLNQPGKSPFHDAGLYYIQEPSAMLPVSLLEVNDSGQRILDLCAAPGGKTTQIADAMNGKGILFANEIISSRAKILSENIERMGVSNAIVISSDPREIADRFAGYFDRILVDAPCSGEGMFRKHPEAASEWSLENVRICADRQSWILDCAANMLKPGGIIVYSTCTFNRLEDEESVLSFLERHCDFSLCGDMHRIFPHKDRGEGHFAAKLKKNDLENAERRYPSEKSVKNEQITSFFDFAKDTLSENGRRHLFGDDMNEKKCEGIYLLFGKQLYLSPKEVPSLKGLKVLRPGLHLGTLEKGRFEPSHALALYLSSGDTRCECNIDSDSDARKYIKGETLRCENGKGWTLVTVNGYSLGWGKTSNSILKNHYPKGLRK